MLELLSSLILTTPDSPGYISYADTILKDTEWLFKADISANIDLIVHRLPLYPILIAICKKITNDHWKMLTTLFQFFTFLYSSFCLHLLCKNLNFTQRNKKVFLTAYLTGMPLIFSFFILTDGLFLFLSIIIFSHVSIFLLTEKSILSLIISACSLFLMTSLREPTLFFAFLLAPLCFFYLRINKNKAILCLAIIISVPCFAQEIILKSWNYSRTNHRILSTGLATALLEPIVDLINIRLPEKTDSHISFYLEKKETFIFSDGINAILKKMKNEKLSAYDIQEKNKSEFYQSFIKYPKERALIFYHNLNRDILLVGLNPSHTLQEWIDPEHTKIIHLSQFIKQKHTNIAFFQILHIFLLNTFRLISLILNLIGFYKIFMILITKNKNSQDYIILGLAIHAFCWIFLQAAVHLEIRYVLSSIELFMLFAFMPYTKKDKWLTCVE